VIKRELQDVLGEGVILRGLGLIYRNQNNHPEALKFFQQAQAVLLKQPDRYWHMISWYDLGNLYYRTQAYAQAVQAFQTALPIARELKRDTTIGELLSKIGFAYHDGGKLPEAIAAYQASLPNLKAAKSPQDWLNVQIQMSRVYNQLGQTKTAIALLQETLTIAQKNRLDRLAYLAHFNLGMIYNGIGQPRDAQPYLQQALTLAQKSQNPADQQLVYGELGLLALNQGDYVNAITALQKSLDFAISLKDQKAEQGALANLGIVYYNLGEYKQAFGFYDRGLKLARQRQDNSLEGKILGSMGILYRAVGDYKAALPLTQASLKIAQAQQDLQEQKVALLDLGLLYDAIGQPETAIQSYQTALKIAQQTNDRALEGKLYGNLGLLYDQQRQYQKAAELFRSSLTIADTTGDRREQAVGRSNLGSTLYHLNQLNEAEQNLRQSIEIWDQQRAELNQNRQYNTADRQKISLFERQNITYRELQRVLIKQNRPEAALEVTEQSRTRALVELIERKRQRSSDRLKENLNVTIGQLQQIARDQSATIVEYTLMADWIENTNADPKKTPAQKRSSKDADLLIWVIQPNGQITLRQVDLRPWISQGNLDFANLIDRGRREIGVRSRGVSIARVNPTTPSTPPAPASLSQLHKILIAPIQDLLPKQTQDHVVIIPHKSLFAVPFYALQDSQGHHLIESHTLRIAPSLQVLGLTQKAKSTPTTQPQTLAQQFPQPLIIGNPEMPALQAHPAEPIVPLDRLPNAEQEAQQVAKLLQTTALIGNQAKKSIVLERMRSAKLIHFATHGLLDDFTGLGLPGAIALAPDRPGQPNDGLLLSDELMDEKLQLSADLVVLSACNTGQGRITGDGVVGLSRAFLAAGVPSVVVSLWAVDDASTSILMTEFYRNLQNTPDRAAALRQAMLTTKKQFPDPYHWAAFTIVGQSPSQP
jgi:CHAT domain-containing protein